MLGVVLCGGQSSRMGTDKGLLKLHASTWAQTAVDKLSELELPIVISINKIQLNDYAAIFSPQQLITDNDKLKIHGPLSAVLSIHLQYPSEDLVLLACDMPLMETELIKELLNLYHEQPAHDAFVFTNDAEPEPLCGIYKSKGLAHILQLYHTNQLPKHSMKYMLEHISTYTIPVPDDKKKAFRNFNAHAELNGL
jgi:molybdopterin-guanine dinucleotide biosynthesis protein A